MVGLFLKTEIWKEHNSPALHQYFDYVSSNAYAIKCLPPKSNNFICNKFND